jgi:hypothetical protein
VAADAPAESRAAGSRTWRSRRRRFVGGIGAGTEFLTADPGLSEIRAAFSEWDPLTDPSGRLQRARWTKRSCTTTRSCCSRSVPDRTISREGPATRARDELVRLSARGLDVARFFEQSGRVLRTAITFDGFCSMTVDPATMLLTSHIAHDSVRPQDVPRLGRSEFLEQDWNKFAVLARAPRPAGVLTEATDHRLERSPRWREILGPSGFGDELRFTLLDKAECWGWVALYRREESGEFDEGDAALAASLSQLLAEGLRRSILLAGVATEGEPDGPGLILLAPGGVVEDVTPAAERWLAKLIAAAPAEAICRRSSTASPTAPFSPRAAVSRAARAPGCRPRRAPGSCFTARRSATPRKEGRPSSSNPHARQRSRR